MLYPNFSIDDVTDLLVRMRENICPNCIDQQAPPELIELLDCNCSNSDGQRCIARAKGMMAKLDAA